MAVKSPNASGIGYYHYTPSSTPTFAPISLISNNDPLILRFRVALEALIGASTKKDLEETRSYLLTSSQSRTINAELNAVNLLLETLDE
ncbi:MAG TPA: hypothetical protein ENH82_18890 [bacterium]|nr:hypothetical protein [bacterium]